MNPTTVRGYGVCYQWPWLNAKKLAKKMRRFNLNTAMIDLFGAAQNASILQPPYQAYWMDYPQWIEAKAKQFIEAMRSEQITTICRLSAMCYTAGREGRDFCSPEYGIGWYAQRLKWLKSCKQGRVAVVPVIEPGAHASTQHCYDRSVQFHALTAQRWTGTKVWNGPANETPAGWLCEYHPQGLHDLGPQGSIVVTDCCANDQLYGPEINPATGFPWYYSGSDVDLGTLAAYAEGVYAFGRGFIWWSPSFPATAQWEALRIVGGLHR